MKSSVEKMDGLFRRVKVEIPAQAVNSAFDRVYKGIQKKANIKGFRPGKAPLSTVKSLYGQQVQGDVLNDLLNEGYQNALDEHDLTPIGQPQIQIGEFGQDKDLSFSAEFEVRPEVNLKKYEGLKVEKEKFVLDEAQVDQVLENIRKAQAEQVPVFEDRPAQEGDVAIVDFEGFIDGQPLPNGKGENHPLELGANQFIEGFEEGVVGMRAGTSKDIELKFPEDYHAKDIAGKPVTFKVTLKELKKKSLPELNDELAKKAGPFDSLEALKEAIRQDITENEEKRIQDDLKNRILRELVKNNPVEVPTTLKDQQKQMIIEDVRQRLSQQGMGPEEFEDYKTKWDSDFEDSANFMIQSTFLVDTIAEKENLKVSLRDVEQRIQEYAEKTGIDINRLNEYYKDSDRKSRMAFQMTEEAVVKFLVDKADLKEVDKKDLKDTGNTNP